MGLLTAGRRSITRSAMPAEVEELPSLLFVATIGGTIRHFLVPYAAHFRSLGWRVEAAASGAKGDPTLERAFDRVYELPLSRSPFDLAGIARSERAMERVLAESSPSILHAHTPIASFVARLAARRMPNARRPAVIYTAHGFHFHRLGHPATNALYRSIERLAGRWTDRLIVINDEDEAAARRYRIVPDRSLIRLPGIGLDTQRYDRSAVSPADMQEARKALQVGDAPVFLVIGELNRNKRPTDVVAALAGMRHTEAALVFAGDGPLRTSMLDMIQAMGLAPRVRLLGHLKDIRPLLGASTAVVLASRREGLPRSIMEALAFGVPVVASDARGNRELVQDDASLVPVGDVPALSRAMDRILDDPARAAELARSGRQRIIERYSLGPLIAQHEAIYRDVLAEASRLDRF